MVVEILKGPPVYTTVQTCGGCKAELKATEEDLRVANFGGDYTERGTPALYFKCPVCDTDVRCKNAPWALLERVRKQRGNESEMLSRSSEPNEPGGYGPNHR